MASTEMFYIAAAMAMVPTLVLMYVLLRKYTFPYVERPYFSDPSFFLLFAVGLVAGTVMFLAYTYILGNLIYIILYAAIQVMVVVAVLNLKRYRGKSDSVFYGLGFGMGAGGSTATGFIYYLANSTTYIPGGSMDAVSWVFLFVVAMSMICQFSAVGITVGEGIARHAPMEFALKAMIYNVVYWIVDFIMLINADGAALYVMAVAVLAISLFYLYYAYTKEIGAVVAEVDLQNPDVVGKRHRPKL